MAIKDLQAKGKAMPFQLWMAGEYDKTAAPQLKYGFNPDSATTWNTIWPQPTPFVWLENEVTLTVSSTSTDDASGGIGAQTLFCQGVNELGQAVETSVILNGQNAVALDVPMKVLLRAFVLTHGTDPSQTNLGIIYFGTGTVTIGVPASINGVIPLGFGQTQSAAYEVPHDTIFYVKKLKIFTSRSANTNIDVRFITRTIGGGWRVRHYFPLFQSTITFDREYPWRLDGGTQMEMQSMASQAGLPISASLEGILVLKDDGSGNPSSVSVID